MERLLKAVLIAKVFCLALTTAAFAESQPSLNQTMSHIGKEMTMLYPVVLNQAPLTATSKQAIAGANSRLLELFRQAGPHIKKKSSTYRISYDLVLDYLEKTGAAISSKNWDYARNRLASLGEVCTSCHAQDTELRTFFGGAERQLFPNDFAYAEFNFYTRNYAAAEEFYDRYIKSGGSLDEESLTQAFRRLVTMYAQIFNQPGRGAQKLSAYVDRVSSNAHLKDQLVAMIFGLQSLEEKGLSKITKPDIKTLEKYVTRYLGKLDKGMSDFIIQPEEEVSRVWLRGQLFHYMNRNPNDNDLPKIVFWLAVADRSLDYAYFFSLADLYLLECITGYSKHPYAERCYQEYREFMLFSYTGSGGEFLPDEQEEELRELRDRLGK